MQSEVEVGTEYHARATVAERDRGELRDELPQHIDPAGERHYRMDRQLASKVPCARKPPATAVRSGVRLRESHKVLKAERYHTAARKPTPA